MKVWARRTSVVVTAVLSLIVATACSSSSGGSKTSKPSAASRPAERVVTMNGATGPGPAQYNRVRVLEIGPRTAKNVLVLEPGTSAGAAYFRLDAEDIVQKSPGWHCCARRSRVAERGPFCHFEFRGAPSPLTCENDCPPGLLSP